MKEKKFSVKYITIAYSIPLALQTAFFIYQLANAVISLWNCFAMLMMVYLFVFAIRGAIKDSKMQENSTEKTNEEKEHTREKLSKKARLVYALIAVVFASVSAIFFGVYANKSKGLQIVNAKVVSQSGETIRDTETTDDGVSTSESDYIEVEVEYKFNGETKKAIIEATTTDKIYVDNLKIYVDDSGKFVNDYGRIFAWKVEAFIFLGFAVMMILVAIFSLGIEFVAGSIFTLAGVSFMFFIGAPLFENFLFNDIVSFVSVFAMVGIYMLLTGVFGLIFGREIVFGGSMFGHVKKEDVHRYEQEMGLLTCKKCGAKVSSYDKFCFHCGTKIENK